MVKKNKISILVALIILYLSMARSDSFDKIPLINIPYFDKFVHIGMYFCLMSAIVLENKRTINSAGHLFLTGFIPLLYGILIEFLQSALTETRTGSFYDALADFTGILVSILLWLWINRLKKR